MIPKNLTLTYDVGRDKEFEDELKESFDRRFKFMDRYYMGGRTVTVMKFRERENEH